MKMLSRFISTAVVGAALLSASMAQAATWAWSYSGTGVTASGTFTTAGPALVLEDILTFTGTRNGTTILGLIPVDTDPNYIYDNQFTISIPHLTEGGILYNVGGSGDDRSVNLYLDSNDGQYHDLRIDLSIGEVVDTVVTFNVSAVPEAATLGYMALGLAGMGLVLRRRKAA